MTFCTLAVVVMINGQLVKQDTPWHGGARTQAEGGLTEANCNQFITKYNTSHKQQLVCVCDK